MNDINYEYCHVDVNLELIKKSNMTKKQMDQAIEFLSNSFNYTSSKKKDCFSSHSIRIGNVSINVVGADEYDRLKNRLISLRNIRFPT